MKELIAMLISLCTVFTSFPQKKYTDSLKERLASKTISHFATHPCKLEKLYLPN